MPILERPAREAAPVAPATPEPVAREAAPAPRPARRRPASLYEAVLAKIAIAIGIVAAAGVWWVGGSFTLAWLQGRSVAVSDLGLLAWLLPAAVTALESGALAARSRSPWLWVIWAGALAFDAYTTSQGILATTSGTVVFGLRLAPSDPSSWAITGLLGLAIALAPEPAIRALWRELWS